MMLVEIILGKKTGDKALAVAIDYVRAIKKTPIVVNDTRGFYVNRCVLRYMSEAYQMLIEGVPAAMIENAAKMAGMPVGPLALTDETAIDLAQKIMKQTIRDLGEKAVDADADGADQHAWSTSTAASAARTARASTTIRRSRPRRSCGRASRISIRSSDPDKVDVEELKQRFLVTIALEAARVMEEGIVTDPREADVGSILAFGFAPYHRRHAVLHRRHRRQGVREDRQGPAEEVRAAVQGAEAASRHGGEGRDLLRALRPLREGTGKGCGIVTLWSPLRMARRQALPPIAVACDWANPPRIIILGLEPPRTHAGTLIVGEAVENRDRRALPSCSGMDPRSAPSLHFGSALG